MYGLDQLYQLNVAPDAGSLAVRAVLANLTSGDRVIWTKPAAASPWTMVKLLGFQDGEVFPVNAARGGSIMLVSEMKTGVIGSSFAALGELLVNGQPVPGSRQHLSGSFTQNIRIEGIQWNI